MGYRIRLEAYFFRETAVEGTVILRLTCPECKKDSFSSDAALFKPCPYCGIIFSGKFGTEKRQIHRVQKALPCCFSIDGKDYTASTVNFSENGLSIKIDGKHSLPVGEIMSLTVGSSALKAKVMWAFDHPSTSVTMSGLEILEGRLNFSEK
ncbi:MAG: PilZ domain-containing protein [Nitrospirota bacterium]